MKISKLRDSTYQSNKYQKHAAMSSSKLFKKSIADSKRFLIVKKPRSILTPLSHKASATLSYIHFKKKKNMIEQNIFQSQKLKISDPMIACRLRNEKKKSTVSFENIQILMKNFLKEKERKSLKLKKRNKDERIMTEKNEYFEPKKYTEIVRKHTIHIEENDPEQLEKMLIKTKKWKKTPFNRYTFEELSSFYVVLLNFAKGELKKFKRGFQVVLNLAGLFLEHSEFQQQMDKMKVISNFDTFAKLYKHFQQYHFKQSIIDSLKVLFHNYLDKQIELSEIKSIFEERTKEKEATLLSESFIRKIRENYGSHCNVITMKEIFQLCYHQNELCQQIYESYIKDIKEKNQHQLSSQDQL